MHVLLHIQVGVLGNYTLNSTNIMEEIISIIQSETFTSLVTIGFGGIGGYFFNTFYSNWKNKVQKMMCYYLDDEVLAKIPGRYDNNTMHENIYCKKYKLVNTTNKDISVFKVIFQFDSSAEILECHSQSKEGYNRQRIRKNKHNKNEAEAIVKNFNRNDAIEYVFRIANITDNAYYITECNSIGFKIDCKDKRKDSQKSKSKKSNQILITKQ